jgi:hypothetical protein
MRTLLALLLTATLACSSGLSFAQDAATVTCKDGSTSKAGKGACSHHGGVNRNAAQTSAAAAPSSTPAPSPMTSKAPSASPAPEPARQPTAKSTPAPATTTGSSTGSKAANSDPTGAIAQCKDGTYSHSKKHTGACSHHGGVTKWLDQG